MKKNITLKLCITAMFMALNVVFSSFSVPVPGGHLYLNDIIICVAGILLSPYEAFVACGIGAFLGDLFFYPAPMFVSLVIRGLQGVIISLFTHKLFKNEKIGSITGTVIGGIIMVLGYTFGRVYIYGSPEMTVAARMAASIMKLPYQIAMAVIGIIFGNVICYPGKLKKLTAKYFKGN